VIELVEIDIVELAAPERRPPRLLDRAPLAVLLDGGDRAALFRERQHDLERVCLRLRQ